MSNVITMQDIKRDSGSNANTEIYFKVRATALRSHLHTEGFSLCPHKRPSTKGPPSINYNSKFGVHNSFFKYNHLYTREKAQSLAQSKEKIKLGDPMITNSLLVISKDHKQFFTQTTILKIDLR